MTPSTDAPLQTAPGAPHRLPVDTGLLFIFDMDEVLYSYDWRERMRGMAELTGLSFEELRRRWWHDTGERAAEAGVFTTGRDYLAAFETAVGCEVDVSEWVRLRGGAMTPWPDSIAAVRRASELGQITLLTNNNALAGEHLATLAPELADLFGDHLLTTSHYGARKPDPAVFARVLAKYEVPAERAFFADDMLENVEGAASIGISAHHFSSGEKMLRAIEEFALARA
jgi:putative hydrolase of the HAD superfamily